MNNIVILGNSGFIGSYLFNSLKKNHSVEGINSKECNLLSEQEVQNYFRNLKDNSIIIFISSIVRTIDNSFNSYEKNVLMAQNISKEIQKNNKIKQIIFLSSIDVYGLENTIPIHEDTVTNPADFYSMSKLMSEFILKKVCNNKNIPLCILRLPGVYGVKETNSTVGKLFNSAKNGTVTIYGEGLETRDFLFINDLFNVINIIIKKEYHGILNVISGESYSILEIAKKVKSGFENTKIIFTKEETISRQNKLSFNNNKLKKIIKQYKLLSTVEGIQYLIERYFEKEKS